MVPYKIACLLQKSIIKTEGLGNCSRLKVTKETGKLNTMCDPAMNMDQEEKLIGYYWDNWNLNPVFRPDDTIIWLLEFLDFDHYSVVLLMDGLTVEGHVICNLLSDNLEQEIYRYICGEIRGAWRE